MSKFEPPGKNASDNCVVSVMHLGDEMYALTETPHLRRVDPATLECVGDRASRDLYLSGCGKDREKTAVFDLCGMFNNQKFFFNAFG